MPKTCAFCDTLITQRSSAHERSKEDIVPIWLARDLKLAKRKISWKHLRPLDNPIVNPECPTQTLSSREHTVAGLLAGRVCKHCNTGWMSRLESQCQPMIRGFMLGVKTFDMLQESERLPLARWAAKTGYALNLSMPHSCDVPSSHRHHLCRRTDSLPDRVAVFGLQHNGVRSIGWLQKTDWVIWAANSDDADAACNAARRNSYKIAVQIGKLVLIVAYWGIAGWNLRAVKGVHNLIWGEKPKILDDPKIEFPWDDGQKATRSAVNMLGLEQSRSEFAIESATWQFGYGPTRS